MIGGMLKGYEIEKDMAKAFRYGIAALGVLVLAMSIYAFALLARYENSVGKTVKNAAMLAVGYFPRTLGMVLFTLALWVLCIRYWRFGVPILLMFGFSMPCYVCSVLMRPIFDRLDGNGEGESTI